MKSTFKILSLTIFFIIQTHIFAYETTELTINFDFNKIEKEFSNKVNKIKIFIYENSDSFSLNYFHKKITGKKKIKIKHTHGNRFKLFIKIYDQNRLKIAYNRLINKVSRSIKVIPKEINLLSNKNQPTMIYGDSRAGHMVHRILIEIAENFNPNLYINTGDFVNKGLATDEWTIFFEVLEDIINYVPYLPVVGNHELPTNLLFYSFPELNNKSYYTYKKDNTLFIILDSTMDLSKRSSQFRWLKKVLRKNKDLSVIPIFHHPLYSTGKHKYDEKKNGKHLHKLFKKYRINLVFNGHDHDYERSLVDGINYIVTGGGGGPLRDQGRKSTFSKIFLKTYHFCLLYDYEEHYMLKVYDLNEKLIDRVLILKSSELSLLK